MTAGTKKNASYHQVQGRVRQGLKKKKRESVLDTEKKEDPQYCKGGEILVLDRKKTDRVKGKKKVAPAGS